MLKANKNELLSFALAGFLIFNSGFTAPHEIENIEETPTQVEQVPIVNNAPSAVSVSESGTIALANQEQKAQFDLINPVEETEENMQSADAPTESDEVESPEVAPLEIESLEPEPLVEELPIEEEFAAEPIEELAPIEEVEYVDEPQYGAIMAMEATAYLPTDGDGYGITAMGIPATYGVAAVDPSIIPLGSRLYVPGYGEAIAADTGGAIYGYRIDLCMESYAQAMEFGRRVVTVYLLDY